MKIVRSKFPHLKMMEDKVVNFKKEIELLNKRKTFSQMNFENEFQQNEHKLLMLRTDRELSALHKKLFDATEYVKGYLKTLESIISEMTETNYNDIIQQSKKSEKEKVQDCVQRFKQFNFKENLEAKLMFYAELKKLLSDSEK